MIRDRKMYVAPTPFGLVSGVAHTQTVILPEDLSVSEQYRQVGSLVRVEAPELIVGYTFDLQANTLSPTTIPNPFAGQEHNFIAWRLQGRSDQPVTLRQKSVATLEDEAPNGDYQPIAQQVHLIETDNFPFEFLSGTKGSWQGVYPLSYS
jgi:hypothetical protein